MCVCVCLACTSSCACHGCANASLHCCPCVPPGMVGRFSKPLCFFKGEGSPGYILKCWEGDLHRTLKGVRQGSFSGSERGEGRGRVKGGVVLVVVVVGDTLVCVWPDIPSDLESRNGERGGCFKDCFLITGSIWTVTHTLQGERERERERAGRLCPLCYNHVSLMCMCAPHYIHGCEEIFFFLSM